jgi:mono/diheme cytochrome c family protein
MVSRIVTAALVGLFVVGAAGSALRGQATPTVWDGVYTEEQAKRGAVLFDRECAGCHGPSGAGGGMAPALTDSAFSADYDGQTVGDLFDRNRNTMPLGKEGQLSGQQNADITAFMLQCNKFPAGTTELATQSMALKLIKYVADRPADRPEPPSHAARPPGNHPNNTEGQEWTQRLDRPDRYRGLKIGHVDSRQ